MILDYPRRCKPPHHCCPDKSPCNLLHGQQLSTTHPPSQTATSVCTPPNAISKLRTLHVTLYNPYLTLPCLAPLQSFPVLPLLFLCSDPGPQCTSMHTLHFTLYIPYLTLLCSAPFQSFRILPVLFLCFDPRPQCTSRTDHTLYYTLCTLPPPNLHPADSGA